MTTTATTWLLAALIALAMGSAHLLDGPSDYSTAAAQEQDLQAAIQTEAAQARFDKAAAQMCGADGWVLQDDASVRCVPRRGYARGGVITVAQVQP